ncbi:MAG: hypothetical protein ACTSYB_16785 [Candidatus Helarchaeota archaeon]
MASHLPYVIAGGIISSEGGSFLIIGLMYRIIFYNLPQLNFLWNIFIIIGAVSLAIGVPLLLIGIYKYLHRYDEFK